MNILVTGAAGYIGSVISERLIEEGYQVIALDDLRQGHRKALGSGVHFVQGDLGDSATLDSVFQSCPIDAVMHLAADSIVTKSMTDPRQYFYNNVTCGLNLLDRMLKYKVTKLIFSSTAAVYGAPQGIPVTEDAGLVPVNPYGESKLMFERVIPWYGAAYGLNAISLRYFNAAGCTVEHGEHHEPETHLIPNVLKVAMGKAPHVPVFGKNYGTEHSTCVRDYIHVWDIAEAHLKALHKIDGAGVRTYNLGNARGYSVLEVIKTAEKVTGKAIPVVFEPPRTGDPPVLVASSERARKELGWTPRHSGLENIVRTAWEWQRRFPDGYLD